MGQAIGTPSVIGFTAGAAANAIGVNIDSCWIGDNSANGVYTMYTVSTGWNITGNYVNGGGTNTTLFSIVNSAHGVSIKGNQLNNAGVAFALGANVQALDATGNNTISITTLFTGTPGSGCYIQSGSTGKTVASNPVLNNAQDAQNIFGFGGGSSADQAVAFSVNDKSDVPQVQIGKTNTNVGFVRDAAGVSRLSFNQAGNTFIDAPPGSTVFVTGRAALAENTGLCTLYGNTPTVAQGIPAILFTAVVPSGTTTQTATLATTPTTGVYRISYYIQTTTVGTGTTATVSFQWNDGFSTKTFTSAKNFALNSADFDQGTVVGRMTTSGNTTWTVTVASAGTSTWRFEVLMERLS